MPGAEQPINTVDAILIALLLITAIDGLRRGFLLGLIDLVALGMSLWLALGNYRALASYLAEGGQTSLPLASAGALVGIFVVANLAFVLAGFILSQLLAVADWLTGVGALNSIGGLVPGVVKGGIAAIVLIHAGTLLSDSSPLVADLRSSDVARRIDGTFTQAAPFVMEPLDQLTQEAPQFVPLIRPGERKELAIPKGITTTVDPESEAALLRLVNQERGLAGLAPLVADEALRTVAREHSQEMFTLGYFSHDSPVSGSPADRVRRAGIRFGIAAENLAYAPAVDVAHRSLMGSADHRRNILSPDLRRIGVGVVQSGVWGRMFTQSFTD